MHPNLDEVCPQGLVAGPPPFVTLNLQGSDIQTEGLKFSIRETSVPQAADISFPATILPSSKIDASGVATALDLRMPAAGLRMPLAGQKWGYTLTLLSADGEKAEWEF